MGLEREIPIKRIVISPNASARSRLDESTVERYVEKYLQEEREAKAERLPAIIGEVVQTGDPSTNYYIVVDGAHRLEAQGRVGRKSVLIEVTHEMDLIPDILDTVQVSKTLLERRIAANKRHGLPFSKEDMRHQVRSLIELGESKVSISRIVGLSRPTLDKWFNSEFSDRQHQDEQDKREYLRLREEGVSCRKAAETLGRASSVCKLWSTKLKDGDSPLSDRRKNSDHNVKALQCGQTLNSAVRVDNVETDSLPQPGADSTSSQSGIERDTEFLQDLSSIFDALTGLPWSPAVESEVLSALLPLLCRKSPGVAKIIGEGGLSRMYDTLRKDHDRVRAELSEASRTISLKEKEVTALRDEVKKRQAHCSYACNYSLQRVAAEVTKFVRAGLSNFQDVAGILESDASQQRAVTVDTALRAAAKFLSLLEWSLQEGFLDQAQRDAFAEFRKRFMALETLHTTIEGGGKRVRPRDVLLRIRKCDAHLMALEANEGQTACGGKASLAGHETLADVPLRTGSTGMGGRHGA